MASAHTPPGEIIDIHRPAGTVGPDSSEMLIRTDHLEVFRYGLVAGKAIQTHTSAGITVAQCLEGEVDVTALGKTERLRPGQMLYLADEEPHSLLAITDAVLLVTLLLHRR